MNKNLILELGYLSVGIITAVIAYKYLGLSQALTAIITMGSVFLSMSLFRPHLRKIDPRRFIGAIVMGFSFLILALLTHLHYVEIGIISMFSTLLPTFVIDYFLAKKYSDLYE